MTLHCNYVNLIKKLCKYGYDDEEIKNIISYRKVNCQPKDIFYIFCTNERLKLVIWYIYYENSYNLHIDFELVLADTCMQKQFKVAKWLIKSFGKYIKYNTVFKLICQKGKTQIAKWLCKYKPGIETSTELESAFNFACLNGHLSTCKWLLLVRPDINISYKNDCAFRWACRHGHLSVVKWLLSIKPNICIKNKNDYAFRLSFENATIKGGSLDVVNWFCKLYGLRYKIITKPNGQLDWQIYENYMYHPGMIKIDVKDTCPICYDSPITIQTSCNHHFCSECLEKYYVDKQNQVPVCPYCKQQIQHFILVE